MRFQKGDKVEVMNNKEVPVSWRPAEILYGGPHAYHVRYDFYPVMASDHLVEIVSKKLVRPLPPLVRDLENCNARDTVEVFYEKSWKVAVVLKILGSKKENDRYKIDQQVAGPQNRFLVRLLGSSQDLVIDGLNVRMRLSWNRGKWTLIGKSSQVGNDSMSSKPSTSNCCRKMNIQLPEFDSKAKYQPENDCMNIQDDAALWESPLVSARSLKRASPYSSSIIEAHNGHVQKLRAIEEEGQKQRVAAARDLEKVDAVAYPVLGEKNMHASFSIISNGYNQTERAKQNDVVGYSVVSSTELNSSDSDASSVGSCSVTNWSLENCYGCSTPASFEESETLCSDAESSNCPGSERRGSSCPPKEDVEVSIRRLELHAYRSTMEALFASGPLSWDQEDLLTNLRIVLHISNDEHLKELKHLISTKTLLVQNDG